MGAVEADDAIAFNTTRDEILNLCRKTIDHKQLLRGIYMQFGIADEAMFAATEVALSARLVERCRQLAKEHSRGVVCDVCTQIAEKDRFFPFIQKALRDAVKAISY